MTRPAGPRHGTRLLLGQRHRHHAGWCDHWPAFGEHSGPCLYPLDSVVADSGHLTLQLRNDGAGPRFVLLDDTGVVLSFTTGQTESLSNRAAQAAEMLRLDGYPDFFVAGGDDEGGPSGGVHVVR